MKSQLMLVKLGKDGADIEVNLGGIRYLQRLGNSLVCSTIDASVLQLETHFQIRKRIPKLIGFAEKTSVVIIGHGAQSIVILAEHLRFLKQILGELEVACLQAAH